MAKKVLGYEALASLAIAAGALTPNPGIIGVQVWSTTLAAPVSWNGTSWNAAGSGGTVAASSVTNVPANGIVATNVQAAIDELATKPSRVVVTTSANTTMALVSNTDYVYFVAGAHLISLPSPNTNRYTVKNNHSADITIDTAGVELIEGAASISIRPESSVDLVSNGTNWFVI